MAANEEALAWQQAISSDDRTMLGSLLQQAFETSLAGSVPGSLDYEGTTDEERARIWRRVVASLDAYVRLEVR